MKHLTTRVLVSPILAIAALVCFADSASADFGMVVDSGIATGLGGTAGQAVTGANLIADVHANAALITAALAGYTQLHIKYGQPKVTQAGGVFTAKVGWTITGRPPQGGPGGGGPGGGIAGN